MIYINMKYFIDGKYQSNKLKETFKNNIWKVSDPPLFSLKSSSEKDNGSLICKYNNDKTFTTPSGDYKKGKMTVELDPRKDAFSYKLHKKEPSYRYGRTQTCQSISNNRNKRNAYNKKVAKYNAICKYKSKNCTKAPQRSVYTQSCSWNYRYQYYNSSTGNSQGPFDYKWTIDNSCIPTLLGNRCKDLPVAFSKSTNSSNLYGTCDKYLNTSNGKCGNDQPIDNYCSKIKDGQFCLDDPKCTYNFTINQCVTKDNKGYNYFIQPNLNCMIKDINSIFNSTDEKYDIDKITISQYLNEVGISNPFKILEEINELQEKIYNLYDITNPENKLHYQKIKSRVSELINVILPKLLKKEDINFESDNETCKQQTNKKLCDNYNTLCEFKNGSCVSKKPIKNPELIDIFSKFKKDFEESVKVLANNLSYKTKELDKGCSKILFENKKYDSCEKLENAKEEKCKNTLDPYEGKFYTSCEEMTRKENSCKKSINWVIGEKNKEGDKTLANFINCKEKKSSEDKCKELNYGWGWNDEKINDNSIYKLKVDLKVRNHNTAATNTPCKIEIISGFKKNIFTFFKRATRNQSISGSYELNKKPNIVRLFFEKDPHFFQFTEISFTLYKLKNDKEIKVGKKILFDNMTSNKYETTNETGGMDFNNTSYPPSRRFILNFESERKTKDLMIPNDFKKNFYHSCKQKKSIEDRCKSQGWENCKNKLDNDKTSLALKSETQNECIYHNGFKKLKVDGVCQKYLYFNRCKDCSSNNIIKAYQLAKETSMDIINKMCGSKLEELLKFKEKDISDRCDFIIEKSGTGFIRGKAKTKFDNDKEFFKNIFNKLEEIKKLDIKPIKGNSFSNMEKSDKNIFETNDMNIIYQIFKDYIVSFSDFSSKLKDANVKTKLPDKLKVDCDNFIINAYNLKEIVNQKDETINRIFKVQRNEKEFLKRKKIINWQNNHNILDLLDNKYKEDDLPLMDKLYVMSNVYDCNDFEFQFRKATPISGSIPKITRVYEFNNTLIFRGENNVNFKYAGYKKEGHHCRYKYTITGKGMFERNYKDLNKPIITTKRFHRHNYSGLPDLFYGVKNDNKKIVQQVITLYENYINFDKNKAVIDAKIENTEFKIKQAKDLIKKEIKNKKNIIDLYNFINKCQPTSKIEENVFKNDFEDLKLKIENNLSIEKYDNKKIDEIKKLIIQYENKIKCFEKFSNTNDNQDFDFDMSYLETIPKLTDEEKNISTIQGFYNYNMKYMNNLNLPVNQMNKIDSTTKKILVDHINELKKDLATIKNLFEIRISLTQGKCKKDGYEDCNAYLLKLKEDKCKTIPNPFGKGNNYASCQEMELLEEECSLTDDPFNGNYSSCQDKKEKEDKCIEDMYTSCQDKKDKLEKACKLRIDPWGKNYTSCAQKEEQEKNCLSKKNGYGVFYKSCEEFKKDQECISQKDPWGVNYISCKDIDDKENKCKEEGYTDCKNKKFNESCINEGYSSCESKNKILKKIEEIENQKNKALEILREEQDELINQKDDDIKNITDENKLLKQSKLDIEKAKDEADKEILKLTEIGNNNKNEIKNLIETRDSYLENIKKLENEEKNLKNKILELESTSSESNLKSNNEINTLKQQLKKITENNNKISDDSKNKIANLSKQIEDKRKENENKIRELNEKAQNKIKILIDKLKESERNGNKNNKNELKAKRELEKLKIESIRLKKRNKMLMMGGLVVVILLILFIVF